MNRQTSCDTEEPKDSQLRLSINVMQYYLVQYLVPSLSGLISSLPDSCCCHFLLSCLDSQKNVGRGPDYIKLA